MELRHLRYFLAVEEHRHFGRAAQALGIKQPPLSQQIQALEAELGLRLFVRTHQGATPTPAGQVFAEHARAAVAAARAAVLEAQRVERGDSGRLVVAFVASALDTVLPRVLSALTRRWPHVALEPVECVLSADAVAYVLTGRADLCVARPPVSPAGGPGALQALALHDDRINVVLPQGHALAGRSHLPVSRLRDEGFILTPLEERPPRYWHGLCGAAGFQPRVVGRLQGLHTLFGMIAAGVGIGLAPQSARTDRSDVVFVPLAPPVLAPPLTLLWRSHDERELRHRFVATTRDALHLTAPECDATDLDRRYRAALRDHTTRVA